MAAFERHDVLGHQSTPTLSPRRGLSSVAYGLAIGMLGSPLVVAIAMWMLASAALAHPPSPGGRENPSYNLARAPDSGTNRRAAVPQPPSIDEASSEQTDRASAAVERTLGSVSVGSAGPCEQGACNHGLSDECCAVSCHLAVGGTDLANLAACPPSSLDPLMSAPSLHGTVVRPGDHPPRSA